MEKQLPLPSKEDLIRVETYVKQVLNYRWFTLAAPPRYALQSVYQFLVNMQYAHPADYTGYSTVNIPMNVLQQKYYGVPKWHEFFLSIVLFFGRLGKHHSGLSDADEVNAKKTLEMLEVLQSEDAAIEAVYAQCGLHFSD